MNVHKRSAILGGALGAITVAGALIAGPVFADDTLTLNSPGLGSSANGLPDGGHHRLGFGGPLLHSEGVAASTDASGNLTYVTVRNQTGKVTAASDSSISIKSDDGYTKTWAISSTTMVSKDGTTVKGSAFAIGDVAMVSGTVDGDAVTATFVGTGGMRGGHGGMRGGHGGMRGGHGHGDMDGVGLFGGGATGTLALVSSASVTGTIA